MKMKRILLALSFLLFHNIAIKAQETLHKFRIGLNSSIEKNVSSESIAFDQYTGYSADYNKTNYRFGLNLEYFIWKNISVNTAINYANKDFTGTYYCDVCDLAFVPSPQEIEFRFIEVPTTVRYYFLPNKISLFGELGLNHLFPLNNEVTDDSYLLGIKLGGGLEYNFTKKIALQVNMDFNNSLSKLNKESDFKLKSFAAGIGIMKRL